MTASSDARRNGRHDRAEPLWDRIDADRLKVAAFLVVFALFYCWAGFGYAPEDDPEMERLGRLREVLGAEGQTSPAS